MYIRISVLAVLLPSLLIGSIGGMALANAQSAGVVINEVELNPKGKDTGTQWVELYNPTSSSVALDGYKIKSSFKGLAISMPSGTTIGAGQFYVVMISSNKVSTAAQSFALLDASGKEVIKTPSLADNKDNSHTWQKVPDGSTTWKFREQTKSAANDPSSIGSSSSSPSSGSSVQGKCSGSGMCLEGKVTGVVDSDTIKIKVGKDEYKVDLSLTKALGKKDKNYASALVFTQTLCLGTNAIVDQDDKQAPSGKKLKGVVYCSERNLNERLLDNSYVTLDKSQCGSSEFASTAWARRNGC
jgi:hypothetical protein